MARIEDEIGKITDPILRSTLFEEVKKLKTDKRFGLVFEEHLPELVPIYNAKIKARSLVALRGRTLNETFKVARVQDGIAEVEKNDGSRESILINELTVVRRFGEPIYPALRPFDRVRNGDMSQPHHILIESDNFHALQLLEYCYSGKVDCIYIDPPYNTGARDWKYNNDYVDINDTWRHSKWLSMMKKRLILARHLLSVNGFLIVSIDDYENGSLSLLLENIFPEYNKNVIAVKYNRSGTPRNGFLRVHEYVWFISKADIKKDTRETYITTRNLRRNGNNSSRQARPTMFFPIFIDKKTNSINRVGETPPSDYHPSASIIEHKHEYELWPIDDEGEERCWSWSVAGVKRRQSEIKIVTYDNFVGLYIDTNNIPSQDRQTIWIDKKYDAATYGSTLVYDIIKRKFPFPKSLYAVKKALDAVVWCNKDALIVDFFAGSGTTLNAVNLLNSTDNGNRQCILVTNNEVSEDEAKTLAEQGYKPGSTEWDKHGICQSVTYPRSKFTILGHRDDGSQLEGEYLTGRMAAKEKARTFKQLGFTEGGFLSIAQRKQLVALIDKVPQSKITTDMPFFVDDDIPASILFNVKQAEAWLEALEDQEHITDFYLVTQDTKAYNSIKQQVQELLGPVLIEEEEKRPLTEGFPANLEYFKLDFLDPAEIQMGRQFAAILPVLWMMAGSRGSLPDAPDAHAPWLIPTDCPFAVLIQEQRFKEFHRHIEKRRDLTHVFIVTNSSSTYHNLKEELEIPHVVQLYKDYLQNFKINFSKV